MADEPDWIKRARSMSDPGGMILFNEAQLLLVNEWEEWVTSEPGDEAVIREMLATWWAMTQASGLEPDVLRGVVLRFLERIDE